MNGVLVPISKSATSQVGYAVKHATKLSLSHPGRLAAIAGAGGSAVAIEPATRHHPRSDEGRAAIAGGIAGWGAHQAAPYPIKWQARRSVDWSKKPSQVTDPERKKAYNAEQKARGKWQRAHQAAGTWNNPASRMYRDFPATHRRAKTFRAFGYTHGGHAGEALSVASIGAGALVGAHISRKRQDSASFSKAHRVEATGGAATIVIANHRQVGAMVDHGVRMDPKGQRVVREVRRSMHGARQALSPTVVHHVAEGVRRYPVFGNRTAMTAAGAALVVHANRRR